MFSLNSMNSMTKYLYLTRLFEPITSCVKDLRGSKTQVTDRIFIRFAEFHLRKIALFKVAVSQPQNSILAEL